MTYHNYRMWTMPHFWSGAIMIQGLANIQLDICKSRHHDVSCYYGLGRFLTGKSQSFEIGIYYRTVIALYRSLFLFCSLAFLKYAKRVDILGFERRSGNLKARTKGCEECFAMSEWYLTTVYAFESSTVGSMTWMMTPASFPEGIIAAHCLLTQ
jgi:heme O synthase-like polyprenyltransferase